MQVEALTATGKSIHASLHQQAQRAAVSTKAGRVSTNRLLARLRHVYVWAIEHDLIETSPFTKGTVSVIKLDRKAESSRSRRLEDGENDRLLAHAGPHLRACIEATLETGMRRGEILGVQWQHVKVSQGIHRATGARHEDRDQPHRRDLVSAGVDSRDAEDGTRRTRAWAGSLRVWR